MSPARPVTLLLGFHNHQPVGNFDHVFEQTTEQAYMPFLRVAAAFPSVRFALHNSGCLWEWFDAHRPDYAKALQPLVERGQVELLAGGFYEPILTSIPHRDRVAQIKRQRDYIHDRFGAAQKAEGLWLTERVWEQGLVRSLTEAGIRYAAVDDYHFGLVGKQPHDLHGYWRTEDEGEPFDLFPIDQNLRYLTPFAQIWEVRDYIEKVRPVRYVGDVPVALPIWDDGEKFGAWPRTYKWVYEDGWLRQFFEYLSNPESGVITALPGEFRASTPPLGTIYLPDASYQEMGVWSLPPALGRKVDDAIHAAEKNGTLDEAKRLYNSATWRNFLVKYPENNLLHKRMLLVSKWLHEQRANLAPDVAERIETSLFKGQCNCAYWHGVFGGLYLPHLRRGLFENLIDADTQLFNATRGSALGGAGDSPARATGQPSVQDAQPPSADERASRPLPQGDPIAHVIDYDHDGRDEIVVRTSHAAYWLHPARGGMLAQWDVRSRNLNLLATLARKEEAYHDAPVADPPPPPSDAATSDGDAAPDGDVGDDQATIHSIVKTLTPRQKEALVYDWHPRAAGLDHFYRSLEAAHDHRLNRVHDVGDFVLEPFEYESVDPLEWTLSRDGHLYLGQGAPEHAAPLRIFKRWTFDAAGAGFTYAVEIVNIGEAPIDVWYAPEFNIGLFDGNDPERRYRLPDDTRHTLNSDIDAAEPIASCRVVSNPERIAIDVTFTPAMHLRAFPIQTVSQSEKDFELNFQSTALLPHLHLALAPHQSTTATIRFAVTAPGEV